MTKTKAIITSDHQRKLQYVKLFILTTNASTFMEKSIMDAKSVLVCYKERSKVFLLPASKDMNELESLAGETKKGLFNQGDEIINFKIRSGVG